MLSKTQYLGLDAVQLQRHILAFLQPQPYKQLKSNKVGATSRGRD